MNRRLFIALPLATCVAPISELSSSKASKKPDRLVFDMRSAVHRKIFLLHARDQGHDYPLDFFDSIFSDFNGEPTAVAAIGVDILVPLEMAERVWSFRKKAGIPLTHAA